MKPILVVVLAMLSLSALRSRNELQAAGGWAITETADATKPLPAFVPTAVKSPGCECESCDCDGCECKPGVVCDKNGCRVASWRPAEPIPDSISTVSSTCSGAIQYGGPIGGVAGGCGASQPVRHVETYRYRAASNRCGSVRRTLSRCRRSCR